LHQDGDAQRDASKAIQSRKPENVVVEDPPPEPNYPRYRVEPGGRASLAAIDPDETEHYRKKKDVARELQKQRRRIQDLQERLYAENERGMLIVLQAMDTGGKDGTIKHVFSGVDPQGCRVSSFKAPSAEEANHDFLWRYHAAAIMPGRGQGCRRMSGTPPRPAPELPGARYRGPVTTATSSLIVDVHPSCLTTLR
jgi:hypothetical protein